MFHANGADFLTNKLLEKSRFFIAKIKEKKLVLKNFYQHHNLHILSHLVKLNSKTVHIKENHV